MILTGDETITVTRRTGSSEVDDYGNPIFDTDEVSIPNALVAFNSTSEPTDVARDAVDARLTLYLPHGTQILDGDIFTVRGSEWVKDGDAAEWAIIGGFAPGVVVNVRCRRG